MAIEGGNTIGGLTQTEILGRQNGCMIFRVWSKRDRSFCNAECAQIIFVGQPPLCPHLGSEGDDVIERKPLPENLGGKLHFESRNSDFWQNVQIVIRPGASGRDPFVNNFDESDA